MSKFYEIIKRECDMFINADADKGTKRISFSVRNCL